MTTLADVGPPVKIRLVKESVQPAAAGEAYHGAFEVLVGGAVASLRPHFGQKDALRTHSCPHFMQ